MTKFWSAFAYGVLGVILCGTIAFYAFAQPVVGGAAGFVLGAGAYLLANRTPNLNNRP